MAKKKNRLDQVLVQKSLADSLKEAAALIMAGQVRVQNQEVNKAGFLVSPSDEVTVLTKSPYVGRGALKLEGALTDFHIQLAGKICADVGSSTGGFTDVMLRHGAEKVYAIDVGYGELDWKLRSDERVVVMERTNARYLERLPEPIDFVSIDVSFISLRLILPRVADWLQRDGEVVALVKPQFEAKPEEVPEGGVVTDTEVHMRVVEQIKQAALEQGLEHRGTIESPIKGRQGNTEFLIHFNLKNIKQI